MSIFGKLAFEVYQILRSYGKTIILYDDSGREVYEVEQATRMFVKPDKIMVSIIDSNNDDDNDDNELRLYLSDGMDDSSIEKMIDSLRQASNRFNVLFSIKKYGKELSPRDFAFGNINESKLYGTNSRSFQLFDNIRMVIEHSAKIDDTKRGSRSRSISNIYVEDLNTHERYKMPTKMIAPARAMARHLSEGGKYHDKIGNMIRELSEELQVIKKIKNDSKKALKNNLSESKLITEVIKNSSNRIDEIRTTFAIISGARNYRKYADILKNNTIFEYNSPDVDKIIEILGEDSKDIRHYISHVVGERMSRFPMVVVEDVNDVDVDIKSITKCKKGIDYIIEDNAIKVFNPNSFSELLEMLSNMNISYKLNLKEEETNMDDYTVGIDIGDPQLRDSLLKDISDDFSYEEGSDFGPIDETKIGFKDSDVRSALEDYIHVSAPDATDFDVTQEPSGGEESNDENNPDPDSAPEGSDNDASGDETEEVGAPSQDQSQTEESVTFEQEETSKEVKEIMDWFDSYDPDKFLGEAGIDIPEFNSVENAIHNSPDLFNLNEFLKFHNLDYSDTDETIKEIADYLFDSVLNKNKKLQTQHIEPDMFIDVAKGVYTRLVLPKLKRDGSVNESEEVKWQDMPSVDDEGALVNTPDGIGKVMYTHKIRRKSGSYVTLTKVRLLNGMQNDYNSQDLTLMPDDLDVKGIRDPSGYDQETTKSNILKQKKHIANNTWKESTVLEDELENYTSEEDMVNEFLASKYAQYLMSITKGKDIDDTFLEDEIVRFLDDTNYEPDDEDSDYLQFAQGLKDKIIQAYEEQGYNIVPGVDEAEDHLLKMAGVKPIHEEPAGQESVIDGNEQTSFIDDVKSDKVKNPHDHVFGKTDDSNIDDMERLRSLAGLGF